MANTPKHLYIQYHLVRLKTSTRGKWLFPHINESVHERNMYDVNDETWKKSYNDFYHTNFVFLTKYQFLCLIFHDKRVPEISEHTTIWLW